MENETQPQTLQERLIMFIRFKRMNINSFEKKTGMSNAFVRNIVHGMTTEKLRGILEQFPELDANWLIAGQGQMIRQQPSQVSGDARDSALAGSDMYGGKLVNNGERKRGLDTEQLMAAHIQSTQTFQRQMGELISLLRSEREAQNRLIAVNNK